MELKKSDVDVLILLKANSDRLTAQQYRTLKGQVLAGNSKASLKGLHKLMQRKGKEESGNESVRY